MARAKKKEELQQEEKQAIAEGLAHENAEREEEEKKEVEKAIPLFRSLRTRIAWKLWGGAGSITRKCKAWKTA